MDKLSMRFVQLEVKHEEVANPEEIKDKYLQLNEGCEIITKLDKK